MTIKLKNIVILAVILLLLSYPTQVHTVRAGGLITLGTAAQFGALAASTLTNTGFTIVTGSIGVTPGTAITGFPPGTRTGSTHTGTDAVAVQAKLDATLAYVTAAALPCPPANNLTGQDLGGLTLVPGVYCFASSAFLTGILTLDGAGQYIFQVGSTLITASSSSVNLINGADPCDVFWQVGSSATLGTFTSFAGNIIALASVGLNTNANNRGGLYALTAAITLDDNDITACDEEPPASTPTPTITPANTATNTPIATSTGTSTPVNTVTSTASSTETRRPTRTRTSTPINTASSTAVATATPTSTDTSTVVPPTATAVSTSTRTATRTSTGVRNTATTTSVPTRTATYTVTRRPSRTPTATRTPRITTKTNTPIHTKTHESTKTKTPTKTNTPYYVTKTPTTGYATKTKTKTPTRTKTPGYVTKTPTPNCIGIDDPLNPSWDCTPTPVGTPTPGGCWVGYVSQNVPRTICDECTVYSNLPVPSGPPISGIEVTNLRISHEYAADLDVFLISPSGTRVELFTDKCGGDEWTNGNTGFTLTQGASQGIGVSCPPSQGVYRPEGSLSVLQGQSRAGVWRLEITDDGPVDVGILYGWGLRITGECEGDVPAVVDIPALPAALPASVPSASRAQSTVTAVTWAYVYTLAFAACCVYLFAQVG